VSAVAIESHAIESKEARIARKRRESGACAFPHQKPYIEVTEDGREVVHAGYFCDGCRPAEERPTISDEEAEQLTADYAAALSEYEVARVKVEKISAKTTEALTAASEARERAERIERRFLKYRIEAPTAPMPPSFGFTPEGKALGLALARRS
jgi:hypothetical protein